MLFSSGAHAELKEVFSKSYLEGKVRDEIADLEIGFDIDLLDIDIAEGVGISSRYRYQVEPSYQAGHSMRIDSWKLKFNLKPGDVIKSQVLEDESIPVYFNIERDSEILFIRQFKRKSKAVKAAPYTLGQLPINARHALKLNPGDFVSIPTNMTIATGISGSLKDGLISAGGNIYLVYSGKFLVQVFRMHDSKVRLRLIAQRDSARGISANSKIDFDIFGIKVVDKQIKRHLELKSSASFAKHKGSQLIVDYIFDLENEDSKKAYNQILSSHYSFKDLDAFSDLLEGSELENSFISLYEDADRIFNEDKNREQKRIDRVFKGFNNYKKEVTNLKLGLILAQTKFSRNEVQSNISYEDKNGLRKKFYYPTYTYSKDSKLDLWILKSKERLIKTYFGLSPVDEHGIGHGHTDIGFTYDRKDQSFNPMEQANFRQVVSDMLPDYLHDQIDWKEWENHKDRNSAVAYFQVIFKKQAFDNLKGYTVEDITKALSRYYKDRELYNSTTVGSALRRFWHSISNVENNSRADFKHIARKLYKVFNDDNIDGKERLNILMKLRKKSVFKKVGYGFLMSLIPEEQLEDLVYIRLNLHARDSDEVKFNIGHSSYSSLYKELMYVNKILNDRSYDLRLDEQEIEFKDKSLSEDI